MTEHARDEDAPAAEAVRDLWKRTERARAAAEIPFVLWSASQGAVLPQNPVQVDSPTPQRIECRAEPGVDTTRLQQDQEQWADHEKIRLQREAERNRDEPKRTRGRSRSRD